MNYNEDEITILKEETFMKSFVQTEYLDDRQWSDLWSASLQRATPFDPLMVNEINVIVPIPEHSGVLIFTDKQLYHSDDSGLTVLNHFSNAHRFPLYKDSHRCLNALGCGTHYKTPWLCPFFTLLPLEDTRRTIWINPLKIANTKQADNRCYLELCDGSTLVLPLLQRSVRLHSAQACYALALLRRDLFRFVKKADTPLAYLELPNTPFARLLVKRPLLSQFTHPITAFSRHYTKVTFLARYEKLEAEPTEIDWSLW